MTHQILYFEYGSRAHGTHTEESDHDYMGIHVEDRETVTGIEDSSTKHDSTAGAGNRSGPHDIDATQYPLRQFAKLAAKGNPTVLTAFFAPNDQVYADYYGELLRNRAHLFLSKEAGARFAGYAYGQKQALTREKNKRTNRPELVESHGYDTKFAYHMIRLQLQGIELMTESNVTLPMTKVNQGLCRSIRAGEISFSSVLAIFESLDRDLKKAIGESLLPDRADYPKINKLLHEIHMGVWED